MRWIALFLLLLTPALAWEEYPPDTPGLQLVDRAYKGVYSSDKETHYYAVLYNGKDQTYLEVYQGTPWKKIHRWAVTFEGEKVKVRSRATLEIWHDEEGQKLSFYWNDFVGYAEAAVHQSLNYDLKTGKFSTSWSD